VDTIVARGMGMERWVDTIVARGMGMERWVDTIVARTRTRGERGDARLLRKLRPAGIPALHPIFCSNAGLRV
jgi:hypothetical protein